MSYPDKLYLYCSTDGIRKENPYGIIRDCLSDMDRYSKKEMCDGVKHCADGSDERACEIVDTGKYEGGSRSNKTNAIKLKQATQYILNLQHMWNQHFSICMEDFIQMRLLHHLLHIPPLGKVASPAAGDRRQ